MKLTPEQAQIVTDNHDLIYWYANMKHLDLDEWYDLLAITLCQAVLKHDSNRSTLSTYFKIRADGVVNKEYRKTQTQKRFGKDIPFVENVHDDISLDDIDVAIKYRDLIDNDKTGILRLKLQGYTQKEIAEMIGVNQSYISLELKRLREEFNND